MADSKDEPAFDPATWTPDKPWPKGYSKPIINVDDPDYIRIPSLYYRRRNGIPPVYLSAAQATTVRAIVWLILACILHLMDAGFVRASHHTGLAHAIASAITPWFPFVALTLVIPTLLYARMVSAPGSSFQRAALFGLGWSLALLVLRFFSFGLPILIAGSE